MIDTLRVGQKLKIKMGGNLYRAAITGLDLRNDAIHVEREDVFPKRCVISPPMIFQVWDIWNEEWSIWKLPSEEEADLTEAAKEQNGNIHLVKR